MQDDDFFMEDTNPLEESTQNTDSETEVDTNTEESTSEQQSTDTQETAPASEDTNSNVLKIPVKFLGEEMELSLDEAAPLVQKGMNYDHIFNENANLKSELQRIKDETAISTRQSKVDAMVSRGYDADTALKAVMYEEMKAQQEEQAKQSALSKTLEERQKAVLTEFVDKFPGVTPKDWTPEMLTAYNNGESLEPHYTRFENQKLKTQLDELNKKVAAMEANKTNAEASTGELNNDKKKHEDPQFKGWE